MKSMNVYDYAVVAAYMVMMVWIGIYFMRYNRGGSDYFRAGNKLNWWIAGLSAFMSSFSAYMYTGGAGIIYQEGLTGSFILGSTALGILAGYLLFAKLWRRSRVTTILEFLDERFNLSLHQVASWTYIPFNILYCATAQYSLAIFITAAIGMDISYVIWICGLVIMVYTLLGGLWAVAITDVVQFLVLLPVSLVLVPLALLKVDNFHSFFHSMPPGYFSIPSQQYPWYWLLVLMLLLVHGQNTNPNAQRYFSVRDEAEAKKVALLCMLLFIAGIMTWTVPPMVMRYLYNDLSPYISLPNPHEGSYVVIAMMVLPHGLIGLMISAIFAATMSSIASQYNSISGIITKDIVAKLAGRDFTARSQLLLGMAATLAVGIITLLLSLAMAGSGQGSFKTMMKLSSLTGTLIATPLLLGFIYRKAPSWSFMFSFTLSAIVTLLVAFFPPLVDYLASLGPAMEFTVTTLAIFFTGLIAFLISPFIFKSSQREAARIKTFFTRLDTPVDTSREIDDSPIDHAPLAGFVGWMSIILGALILPFTFIPAPLPDRMINLSLGSILVAFGGLLYYLGKEEEPEYGRKQESGVRSRKSEARR